MADRSVRIQECLCQSKIVRGVQIEKGVDLSILEGDRNGLDHIGEIQKPAPGTFGQEPLQLHHDTERPERENRVCPPCPDGDGRSFHRESRGRQPDNEIFGKKRPIHWNTCQPVDGRIMIVQPLHGRQQPGERPLVTGQAIADERASQTGIGFRSLIRIDQKSCDLRAKPGGHMIHKANPPKGSQGLGISRKSTRTPSR